MFSEWNEDEILVQLGKAKISSCESQPKIHCCCSFFFMMPSILNFSQKLLPIEKSRKFSHERQKSKF